jgi:hypothetical protein
MNKKLKSEFELAFAEGSKKAQHSGELKIVGKDIFIYMRSPRTDISGWIKDEDAEDLAIAILVERGYQIKPL